MTTDTAKNSYQRETTSKNSYQRETSDKNSYKRDTADKNAYQREATNQNSHQRETMTVNAGNDRNTHTDKETKSHEHVARFYTIYIWYLSLHLYLISQRGERK